MMGLRSAVARRAASLAGVVVLAISALPIGGLDAIGVRAAGPSSPTFVQTAASTTKAKFAFANPVGAGNLLVAGITTNDGGTDPISGVSDSLNGVWTKVTSLRYGNGHVELYYRANSAAGIATVTFAGSQSAFTIAEYSGVQGSPAPLDQFASRPGTGSPTAGPTTAIAGANELVIGVGGNPAPSSSSNLFSAGTGFTLRSQAVAPWTAANGLEDLLSSAAAGQSMMMKSTVSSYFGGVVAVFKATTNTAPIASLNVTPSSGAAPLSVTADASASTSGVGIASYTFAFGDGTVVVGPQPGATAPHTYSAGGNFTAQVTVMDTAGATATATASVTVGAPVAALTLNPTSGATPLLVTANASGSTDPIGISKYTFNFGDGSPPVGPQASATATHTYTVAGPYTVTVTVQDGAGASAVGTASLTVGAPPTAGLAVSPQSGAAPVAITADASTSTPGSNPITSYTFNFGDGTPAIGPQAAAKATHTYAAGGNFTAQVTVTDSAGASSSKTQAVAVGSPTATLNVTPSSGGAPLNVTADASGSTDPIGITSYTFNFGDGTILGSQAGPTATHTYTATGPFTVTVTVGDSAGGSASKTASVTVAAPPTPALNITPALGAAPLSVTADASASTAGTNPIATYKFDFGDGTKVGPQASPTATHVYGAGGIYAASVTVTDTIGLTATANQKVTASAPPTAALAVSPSSGTTPLAVTADSSGSVAGSNPIASYKFNFGDGTIVGPQTAATAAHTYASAGAYTVTVTVTDSAGATATATGSVTAVAPPSAALTVSPSLGATPLAVNADASSSTQGTNPIASYTFNFGDGTIVGPQAAATAAHTYTVAGSYLVKVTVSDTKNVSATASAAVTAVKPLTPRVTMTPPSGGVPLSVTVDGSTSSGGTNPIATYSFNFGDGTLPAPPSSTAAVAHTYSGIGSYTVTLTVTDTAGVSASTTASVTVVNPPTAVLTAAPSSGVAPVAVTADASGSSDAIGISSYMFDFGDGSAVVGPQTAAKATHAYTTAGNFSVTVTVTDTALAKSLATAQVAVLAPPAAMLTETPISGYAPLSVVASASTSTAGTYPIASYTFNFADGTPAVGPQPGPTTSHTYNNPGIYTAMLAVTDTQGNTGSATATVTVSSGVLGQDTFLRPNQTTWGTASNGAAWAPAGASLSISGNEGFVSSTASSVYELLGTATIADANGVVRFSTASGANTAGIILRAQPNGNMYLARYDGAGHLQFEYRIGTSWTHISLVTFTPSLNTFYWLRFQLQGTNVSLKAWAYGTTEPASWNWSGTSSGITGAGQMGLYGYAGTGTPLQFDTFSVSAIGNPVPNSTITGTVTDVTSGAAIAGVQVSTLPVTTTTTTDSLGNYSLSIPAGNFSVVFTASTVGYNANFIGGVQAPINGTVSANQKLLAIPAQVAMDTFTQPNQSNGFGVSTDGNLWSNDFARYPSAQAGITSGQAWVDAQASSQTDLDTWIGYQYQNEQVSVDLNMNTILVDPVFQHGARVLARVQNSTTWVLMTIDPTAQDLTLWATLNDTWTQLAVISHAVSTNAWYHAKLTVIGNLVEGKVWAFGATEPGWEVTASQHIVNGAGQAGLRTTGAYVQYSNFQETPITQIAGTVTSLASGAPIANATVTLNTGATTTTDASGSYTLSGLSGGTLYTVTVAATGYTQGSIQVTSQAGTTASGNVALS